MVGHLVVVWCCVVLSHRSRARPAVTDEERGVLAAGGGSPNPAAGPWDETLSAHQLRVHPNAHLVHPLCPRASRLLSPESRLSTPDSFISALLFCQGSNVQHWLHPSRRAETAKVPTFRSESLLAAQLTHVHPRASRTVAASRCQTTCTQ